MIENWLNGVVGRKHFRVKHHFQRERERERERERVRERERKTKKYLIVCENGCVLPSVCKRKSVSSVTKWKDYYSIFGHLQ